MFPILPLIKDMTPEDLDACGISEGLLRLSVGLESSKDISKDILSALDRLLPLDNEAA